MHNATFMRVMTSLELLFKHFRTGNYSVENKKQETTQW